VLQCINVMSSNPDEGRTKNGHLKHLILTLLSLIFRRIYIFSINIVCDVTLKSSG
jgi:4-hydroxybenzoate polyprenyltransferase